jgi:Tfp pilus assembly protein PilE
MQKRGQTATETLVVLAAVMAVLVIILGINQDILNGYNSRFKIERTMTALNDLTNAAESVYQQGVGAKTKVYVSFPPGIGNDSIEGQIIKFTLKNENIIQRKLDFNVSGDITTGEGKRFIIVESTDDFVSFNDSS